MNPIRVAGIVLIIAGVLSLAYGKLTYTKDTHDAEIGSVEVQVKEKETVELPTWLGAGGIALGVILLLIPYKVTRTAHA